jgi:hypothetical protein
MPMQKYTPILTPSLKMHTMLFSSHCISLTSLLIREASPLRILLLIHHFLLLYLLIHHIPPRH